MVYEFSFTIRSEFKTQMSYLNSPIYVTANKNTSKYFGLILANLNVEKIQTFINEYSMAVNKNYKLRNGL